MDSTEYNVVLSVNLQENSRAFRIRVTFYHPRLKQGLQCVEFPLCKLLVVHSAVHTSFFTSIVEIAPAFNNIATHFTLLLVTAK